MNILHDKSFVKSSSAKWIDRGYAREDVHSLRLQYVYTPEPVSYTHLDVYKRQEHHLHSRQPRPRQ